MKTALVVPCTKTKVVASCDTLAFDRMNPGGAGDVAFRWWKRAQDVAHRERCENLYAGTGWRFSMSARHLMSQQGDECQMFVTSAGFGLLRSDEEVPAYSATFSPQENRVARRLEGYSGVIEAHRAWWTEINQARDVGPQPLWKRLQNFERVVVGISHHYLLAMQDDLNALATEVGPGRLYVVTTGAVPVGLDTPLRECVLDVGVGVQRIVGGPRITLNGRALEWLLQSVVPQVGWVRSEIEALIASRLKQAVASTVRQRGERLSDEDVKKWIASQLQKAPGQSRNMLLQSLRASGKSCEERRFGLLVQEVRAEMPHGEQQALTFADA